MAAIDGFPRNVLAGCVLLLLLAPCSAHPEDDSWHDDYTDNEDVPYGDETGYDQELLFGASRALGASEWDTEISEGSYELSGSGYEDDLNTDGDEEWRYLQDVLTEAAYGREFSEGEASAAFGAPSGAVVDDASGGRLLPDATALAPSAVGSHPAFANQRTQKAAEKLEKQKSKKSKREKAGEVAGQFAGVAIGAPVGAGVGIATGNPVVAAVVGGVASAAASRTGQKGGKKLGAAYHKSKVEGAGKRFNENVKKSQGAYEAHQKMAAKANARGKLTKATTAVRATIKFKAAGKKKQ